MNKLKSIGALIRLISKNKHGFISAIHTNADVAELKNCHTFLKKFGHNIDGNVSVFFKTKPKIAARHSLTGGDSKLCEIELVTKTVIHAVVLDIIKANEELLVDYLAYQVMGILGERVNAPLKHTVDFSKLKIKKVTRDRVKDLGKLVVSSKDKKIKHSYEVIRSICEGIGEVNYIWINDSGGEYKSPFAGGCFLRCLGKAIYYLLGDNIEILIQAVTDEINKGHSHADSTSSELPKGLEIVNSGLSMPAHR